MDTIAFIIRRYLNITETFIYEPLRNMKDHKVIVITESAKNLNIFPHSNICSLSDSVERGPVFYRNALLQNHIRLIHAHFAWEGIRMTGLKKKLNLPLITGIYGKDVYEHTKDPFYRWRLRRLFKHGDLFLTFSEKMRERIIRLGCPANKAVTHHGGADFRKFTFSQRSISPGQRINLLMVGRFVEKKGFEYGIRAFSEIEKIHPAAHLNIIGSGAMQEDIERLIFNLGLGKKISLLGSKNHDDYIKELSNSHLLIAPSVAAKSGDEEGGINTVVIEAFATGLPVVATIHAGSELVFDNKTGFLAEEANVKDLADKIDRVLSSPELLPKLGQNARKLVESDFDMLKQTGRLEAIYKELIKSYAKKH